MVRFSGFGRSTRDLPGAGNLGGVDIQEGWSHKLGGCNFCNTQDDLNSNYKVWQVSGHRSQVRFCYDCFEAVKKFS